MSPARAPFRVGAWVVDPGAHEISNGGQAVRLEPRVMRLLVVLAENAGTTLTRDELFESVWDGEHVEPSALNRSVSQLRKALGDDARDPRVVQTIPRRGYRLTPGIAISGAEPRSGRFGGRAVRSSLIAASLAGLVGVAAAVRPWARDAATPLATRPLTSLRGLETWPALSPDGAQLAFVWTGESVDRPGLYVQQIADGNRQLIAEASGALASPVWSRDGHQLAFLSSAADGCTVVVWSAERGHQDLAACQPGTRLGLAWAPLLDMIAIAEPGGADGQTAIVLISMTDGTRRRLTTPPAGTVGDGEPTFHPTGTKLAFTRYRSRTHHDLHVVDVRTGVEHRVTDDGRYIAGHTWSGDGDNIVFSSNRSGNFRLWRVPSDGGSPQWLNTIATYDPGRPNAARNAHRLAYSEWFFEFNIWVASLDGGAAAATRVIASTRWDRQPQWSPDGGYVAFVSDRTGNDELWLARADGSEPTMLTRFGDRAVSTPSWSPDGQHLAFHATGGAGADVFAIGREGGSPRLLAPSSGNDEVPTWSRDGRSILFASDRSGRWETYRTAATGEGAKQITSNGGYFAREGLNGQILFTRFARPGLWALDAGGNKEELVPLQLAAEDWGNWEITVAGDVWFVNRPGGSGSEISLWHRQSGVTRSRLITERTIPFGAGQFSVRSDGVVAYSQTDRAESDIRMVEGFGLPPL